MERLTIKMLIVSFMILTDLVFFKFVNQLNTLTHFNSRFFVLEYSLSSRTNSGSKKNHFILLCPKGQIIIIFHFSSASIS
jgi:hypothetical protein